MIYKLLAKWFFSAFRCHLWCDSTVFPLSDLPYSSSDWLCLALNSFLQLFLSTLSPRQLFHRPLLQFTHLFSSTCRFALCPRPNFRKIYLPYRLFRGWRHYFSRFNVELNHFLRTFSFQISQGDGFSLIFSNTASFSILDIFQQKLTILHNFPFPLKNLRGIFL